MKIAKLAAVAALIAVSTTASAWWGGGPWGGSGWDNNYNRGYGRTHGWGNTTGDFLGDAAGAGDFSMNMSGRARTNMRGYADGYGYGDGWGRGYNHSAPYWGGHAPYGYGAPYAAAPQMSEEQQKAMAEQQGPLPVHRALTAIRGTLEALAYYQLDNMLIFVDVNGHQVDGAVADTMAMDPLDKKLEALGMRVIVVDGHDCNAIEAAGRSKSDGRPTVVLAVTDSCRGAEVLRKRAPKLHFIRFSSEEQVQELQELLDSM